MMLVHDYHNKQQPGRDVWTWCSACHDRTDHSYQPDKSPQYVCLRCERKVAK